MAKRQNTARKRRNPIVTAKVNEASLESVLRLENQRLKEEEEKLKAAIENVHDRNHNLKLECENLKREVMEQLKKIQAGEGLERDIANLEARLKEKEAVADAFKDIILDALTN